jgi:hypothetical protein
MEVKIKSRYPKTAFFFRLAGGLLILPIPVIQFIAHFTNNPGLNLFYRDIYQLALEFFTPGAILMCLGIILETYRKKVYSCTQCGARVEVDK